MILNLTTTEAALLYKLYIVATRGSRPGEGKNVALESESRRNEICQTLDEKMFRMKLENNQDAKS